MIESKYIHDVCESLVRKVGTRDVFELMRERNISLRCSDLGSLLGMYSIVLRNKYVLLNSRLDEFMERMVAAHELGHDLLHQEIAKKGGLQEFGLFNLTNRTEYEANAFAAHLLIPDEEFMECIHDGKDIMQISSTFGVNINLALIKVQEMINLGYDMRVPMTPDSKFLKDIQI